MAIGEKIRWLVRQRANFACEYCGVSEIDAGGELCVDHYQPKSRGGSDDLENLVYCCVRCNLYKGDHWQPDDPAQQLWNPREASLVRHFRLLRTGALTPLTECGVFTIESLQLNRPQRVQRRWEEQRQQEAVARKAELLRLIDELLLRHDELREEQRAEVLEHRRKLAQLLKREKE